jgi:DNA-binding response OmpR family regulator
MAILVVDDEPHLRQAFARTLSGHGHSVELAANGREAVHAASHRPFDLMVLDINLPDVTGWEVLHALHSSGTDIRTVVISALPPSAARLREFRPFGVLHKPFPVDALLRLVGQAERDAARARGETVDA